jgi:chromosome segregation ATPase
MNRRLQIANLVGVCALVLLCVFQWNRNRQSNLAAIHLEKVRQSQAKDLADQTNAIQGLTRDLAEFKERFSTTHAELAEGRDRIEKSNQERERLEIETSGLKTALTNWTEAVALRDARLKEANDQINDLASRLNESIRKFNGLATNYNAVVAQLNARAQAQNPPPPKE